MVQEQKKLPFYSLFDTTNLDDVKDSILSSKDSFVAVDMMAMDPPPTTGFTRKPTLGDLHPLQLVCNKSSTISIS